jgi:hypothetical protein
MCNQLEKETKRISGEARCAAKSPQKIYKTYVELLSSKVIFTIEFGKLKYLE